MTNKRMDQEVVVVVVMLLMNSPSFMVWNLWKCFEELFVLIFLFLSSSAQANTNTEKSLSAREFRSFFLFGWEEF